MSPLLEPTRLSEREEMANVSHPDERMQLDPLLDSSEIQREQNGETDVVTIPAQSGRRRPTGVAGSLAGTQICDPVLCGSLCVLVLFSLILIIIFTVTAQSPKTREPFSTGAACPEIWVMYLGKCCYFSEAEATWTDGQKNCSAFGASLAGIDTQQEMDFIMRHKGPSDHWIGLRRSPGQPWEWSNGNKFNHLFDIRGGGDCAYVDILGIASSSCSGQLRWVCCRPEGRTKP